MSTDLVTDPLDCGDCYEVAHDELDEREQCDRHAEGGDGEA